MEAIRFEHLDFTYPGQEKKALNDISITIRQSEFAVLCGKSGCGKSTLLRHIKKSMMPFGEKSGKVFISGEDLETMDDRKAAFYVGFVMQDPGSQIVTDKVWHELAFGLESLGIARDVISKHVAEMASFFGIQTWFEKDTKELSGGQQQLLNLASIMVMHPQIVILDEPTAQLDPIASREFINILVRINQEFGTTILISEHRLEELFSIANRVLVMEQGKIIIADDPQNVGNFLAAKKHDLSCGLPAMMRIFSKLEQKGACPLTIREGRSWLKQFTAGYESHEEVSDYVSEKKDKKDVIISLEDIWFRYERNEPDVLKKLDIFVYQGEILGVMGGNGVGKSTVLKVIGGIKRPYRGNIRIHGKTVLKNGKAKEKPDISIGILPQNPQALFTEITVEEELMEAFGTKNPSEDMLVKCQNMLEEMNLTAYRQTNPYDLSGGEQQRLALGKILLTGPKLLLLDEPTKGIDPYFKQKLADILLKLKTEGITIILVSHDVEFCAEYADRCAMFFNGSCASIENAKKFFSNNYFYTTAANKIARFVFPEAVTCQEVAAKCREIML